MREVSIFNTKFPLIWKSPAYNYEVLYLGSQQSFIEVYEAHYSKYNFIFENSYGLYQLYHSVYQNKGLEYFDSLKLAKDRVEEFLINAQNIIPFL